MKLSAASPFAPSDAALRARKPGLLAFMSEVFHDWRLALAGVSPKATTPTRSAPDRAKQGAIALVGAGPGARDLLTLRAAQRLSQADIIFYDRLVDPEVLELARREAELVYVGKAVGACAWPQERIDAVIVAAALQGKRVVRLKSGDPCMFGRATEELAAARANGIPVEIVPGVTAASAAGAALGRSLTERGATDRVVFATGMCRADDDTPDWGASTRAGTTLALYMGVRQAPVIEANLIAAGVPAVSEVEIVSDISTDRQRIATCQLGALAATIRAEAIGNPAIILIRHDKGAARLGGTADLQSRDVGKAGKAPLVADF
ncbi:uroporphyrinogen-III C-methyltransferase [Thioclava sp. JE_KL1]|uniref:uroporphyrinogen-III C-methyltransferase n=1 Tax=Thioclava sp. JE_KL1 TaxID=2651187 RepID=UPI0020A37C35|nr:uroporphyrinogen-III C-methyltransferase [Thioclava sp. JE_KL1]